MDAEAEHIDRSAAKALFLGCAEGLCDGHAPVPSTASKRKAGGRAAASAAGAAAGAAGAALSAPDGVVPVNSSACALRLLRLWLNVSAQGGAAHSRRSTASPPGGGTARSERGGRHSAATSAGGSASMAALGVLRSRVATLRSKGRARADEDADELLPLSATCLEAWARSGGGTTFPRFA